MKRILQIIALLVVVISLTVWLLDGAHLGWTTTQTPVVRMDEITGIEYTSYIDELTFGIELPILGTITGAVLWLVSRFFKKSTHKSS